MKIGIRKIIRCFPCNSDASGFPWAKQGHPGMTLFGWLTFKWNPSQTKRKKRAPLGNWGNLLFHESRGRSLLQQVTRTVVHLEPGMLCTPGPICGQEQRKQNEWAPKFPVGFQPAPPPQRQRTPGVLQIKRRAVASGMHPVPVASHRKKRGSLPLRFP